MVQKYIISPSWSFLIMQLLPSSFLDNEKTIKFTGSCTYFKIKNYSIRYSHSRVSNKSMTWINVEYGAILPLLHHHLGMLVKNDYIDLT